MPNISCTPKEPPKISGAKGLPLFGCCPTPTTSSVYVSLTCVLSGGRTVDGFYPADAAAEAAMGARVTELLIQTAWKWFSDSSIQSETCFSYYRVDCKINGSNNFISSNQMELLFLREAPDLAGKHVGAICGASYPTANLPIPFRKLQGGTGYAKKFGTFFGAAGSSFEFVAQKSRLLFATATGGTIFNCAVCDFNFRVPATAKKSNLHVLLPSISAYRTCTTNCSSVNYSALQPQ